MLVRGKKLALLNLRSIETWIIQFEIFKFKPIEQALQLTALCFLFSVTERWFQHEACKRIFDCRSPAPMAVLYILRGPLVQQA